MAISSLDMMVLLPLLVWSIWRLAGYLRGRTGTAACGKSGGCASCASRCGSAASLQQRSR